MPKAAALTRTEQRAAARASRARNDGRALLTVAEAAVYLNVHIRTVRRIIASGELRSMLVESRRRIRPSDLDDYLDRRISS
jgi:excisionase family DNA binding protein